ncbi:hypothetical protein PSENEW3_00004458 [Picochlorum sp. SENEW3]|nr:hypothetical protein PSENEW3_00004458 [Picochlorum sp. SENEW3]
MLETVLTAACMHRFLSKQTPANFLHDVAVTRASVVFGIVVSKVPFDREGPLYIRVRTKFYRNAI